MFGTDGNQPAPATRELLDAEIRRLLDEGAEHARQTLAEHRSNLDALVRALLDSETLDADEAYRAAAIPRREGDREIVIEGSSPMTPQSGDGTGGTSTIT